MNKKELVEKHLEKILELMSIDSTLTIEEDEEGAITATIEGKDLSYLIGYRGESLDALQTLLSLIIFKETNEWTHLLVDINGYRKQKQDKIEQIAKNYIDKVRFLGKEVEMSPMSSYERRQVHSLVSQYDDITSESTGEGISRRVVLKPKQD